MNYAHLDHLWWGVSIGGRHYTGTVITEISGERKRVELERKLSLREAKEIGETEGRMWIHRISRVTNKFDTMKQLDRHALKWCAANLPRPWVLMENDHWNPNRIVGASDWDGKYIAKLNKIAASWDKVPNWQRTNEVIHNICKIWEICISYDPTTEP